MWSAVKWSPSIQTERDNLDVYVNSRLLIQQMAPELLKTRLSNMFWVRAALAFYYRVKLRFHELSSCHWSHERRGECLKQSLMCDLLLIGWQYAGMLSTHAHTLALSLHFVNILYWLDALSDFYLFLFKFPDFSLMFIVHWITGCSTMIVGLVKSHGNKQKFVSRSNKQSYYYNKKRSDYDSFN